MKFLEKYDFNKEEIADFLNNSPKKLIDAIKTNKKLVCENINYLKDLGVTNYQQIFLEYYDMFLMDHSNFVEVFSKYEPEDLIEKLKKNVRIVEYL
ncbi:MAG: hypothetical protein E7161_00200 [Firmicutes bacterium]|nr:hypothetical protein [Bacillota bacterium]